MPGPVFGLYRGEHSLLIMQTAHSRACQIAAKAISMDPGGTVHPSQCAPDLRNSITTWGGGCLA